MSLHTHVFNVITASPDIRACAWSKCRETWRVPVRPAPAVESSPTSVAAARLIEGSPRHAARVAVFQAIAASTDGLTDERGIEITGLSESTYRPRRLELMGDGAVRNSGKTRLTKRGRDAVVWVAVG